jgi:nicotinamide phosphoribosyltransferase
MDHVIEEDNIITLTDSYKVGHWKMFPPDTQQTYFYLESRGGEFEQTAFFGLQHLIKKYLAGPVVTAKKIQRARKRFSKHFGRDDVFNEQGWRYILDRHNGHLPIEIKAVPEGTVTDVSNILLSCTSTDEKCWWVPGYLEPLFVQLWYPITVCTLSGEIKKIIDHYMALTSDNPYSGYKLHDFGFRGVSSPESAGIGGAAHLVNFKGTDTLKAMDLIEDYYGDDDVAHSIPATEHSTITSWGEEHELEAYDNLLTQFPTGLVACVSDSYDIYNACENLWGNDLRTKVLSREGCLVIRPDSGDPGEVVFKLVQILGNKFGFTVNSKGFKVLNDKVRIIQGDGVDIKSISSILGKLAIYHWSAENIAFGSGGALLQKMNRDTQKFAYKLSAIRRSNVWHDVFKKPVGDSVKVSKKGRLKLVNGLTVRQEMDGVDQLQTVYSYDGYMFQGIETKFEAIRNRRWPNG